MKTKLTKLRFSLTLAVSFLFLASPVTVLAATSSIGVSQNSTATGPINSNSNNGTTSGGKATIQIQNVSIKVNTDSAVITWKTNHYSQSKLSWGTSQDYAMGVAYNQQQVTDHTMTITALAEKTQYYFLITSNDDYGATNTYAGEFITLSSPDVAPPANVTQFSANAKQSYISLSWVNPGDSDFDFVRVVRSTVFFPLDPFSGQVIYEGIGTQTTDSNVTPGQVYYYTIFSRDRTGNFSSGATAYTKIYWFSDTKPIPQTDLFAPIVDIKFLPADHLPNVLLTARDFIFSINDGQTILESERPNFTKTDKLKIALPKNKLFPDASVITATVSDPTQGIGNSSYLFAFNDQTQKYELILPPFNTTGRFDFSITIFNSEKKVLESLTVPLSVTELVPGIKGPTEEESSNLWLVFPVAFFILILVILFLWRRRKKDESNTR